ncbi:hypothetical protein [Tardiphaga sp. 42S5]|uniref:hypothetical protein n=1 Tax=Tardiphaga sp. 42S5 TaxID=1404799 RepID=UPI002A5A5609|nr:hypothetical protein [Tardiphaga sp. 42S5]WPO39000.1 hypothetical protein SFY93_15600 [Tardiphaga sp. 42S5]
MDLRENVYLRHQLQRFMRPDAARYLNPHAARFLKPGSEKADVYPALARKYEGQPRIPEGEGGGQFMFGRDPDRTGTGSGRPYVIVNQLEDLGAGGDNDSGDAWENVQLAGDLGGPTEEPPQIPDDKPPKSSQRNAVLRSIASFLGRNSGLIADVFIGLMNEIEWLESYQDLIQAARDPPKTMRELQNAVGKGRRGYDDHHIIEQTAAERWRLSRSQIDDRSNVVSIPRLKHYQITGWYMTKNADFGGLTPREYLSDKSLEERRRVGLDTLELFKVLQR